MTPERLHEIKEWARHTRPWSQAEEYARELLCEVERIEGAYEELRKELESVEDAYDELQAEIAFNKEPTPALRKLMTNDLKTEPTPVMSSQCSVPMPKSAAQLDPCPIPESKLSHWAKGGPILDWMDRGDLCKVVAWLVRRQR